MNVKTVAKEEKKRERKTYKILLIKGGLVYLLVLSFITNGIISVIYDEKK